MELNLEQIEYLKGLDSKKKQRKFLLDCLVESIIGESVKIKDDKCEVCLMYPKIKNSNKCESCDFCIKNYLENNPYFISLMSRKVTDSPSKKAEEINRLNSLYTTTTASRTFENIQNRQEYGTGNFDFGKAYVEAIDRIIPKDELLKFDAMEEINEEFEKNIKTNLLARGFSVSQVLNNRGLIGATIEETIDEMKKHHESANSKKKYTEEDMFNCFQESRITNAMIGFKHIDFAQYLNSLEK